MLSTCDHDGVISCYRALKGMTDLWPAERSNAKPRLSLALLDAADEQQADRVGSKLLSVCQQFLNLPLELARMCRRGGARRVNQHVVMCCRAIHDKWSQTRDCAAVADRRGLYRESQIGCCLLEARKRCADAER